MLVSNCPKCGRTPKIGVENTSSTMVGLIKTVYCPRHKRFRASAYNKNDAVAAEEEAITLWNEFCAKVERGYNDR